MKKEQKYNICNVKLIVGSTFIELIAEISSVGISLYIKNTAKFKITSPSNPLIIVLLSENFFNTLLKIYQVNAARTKYNIQKKSTYDRISIVPSIIEVNIIAPVKKQIE